MTRDRTKVYYGVVKKAVENSDLIKEVHVVKGPDSEQGYGSYVFAVLREDVARDDETRRQIMDAASQTFQLGNHAQTLKSFELPRKIIFVDALPLTVNNKIDFKRLERWAEAVGEDGTEVPPELLGEDATSD